jgi:5-methylcytosine-specific restriction enzyme subunit McrC
MVVEAPSKLPGSAIGQVAGIPVRNLWLLMLYASQIFQQAAREKVAIEDNPEEIPDLVAEILARMVEKRLTRNLTFGYRPEYAVLGRVRGRIDLLTTERSQLLLRGRVACRFENLTVNTPRNRYVRAALLAISRIVHAPGLRHRCSALASNLTRIGVAGEMPARTEVDVALYSRHDIEDQLMVAAAQLAFDLVLPTEFSGTRPLLLPSRDVAWVRRLYEKAVGGFYDVVLSPLGWRVRMGQSFGWLVSQQTAGIEALLPSMRTDVTLTHEHTGRRVIIDTKFTSILTSGWYREESLKSGYLYQMYAYLRSQEANGDPLLNHASGLLLHPCIDKMVDETVVIQGHAIRFGTVNLAAGRGFAITCRLIGVRSLVIPVPLWRAGRNAAQMLFEKSSM